MNYADLTTKHGIALNKIKSLEEENQTLKNINKDNVIGAIRDIEKLRSVLRVASLIQSTTYQGIN